MTLTGAIIFIGTITAATGVALTVRPTWPARAWANLKRLLSHP